MPRQARVVFPGVPHHVTQRGNRRERVFFNEGDRKVYLEWLREYATRNEVGVLAYCLMTNHVHLIVVPATKDGLYRTLRPLHTRFAQRINRSRNWKGHVWQGRFFSSALDTAFLLAAIRYVERNPVRARMIDKAEDYPWSSAAIHCGLRTNSVLSIAPQWQRHLDCIRDWSAWLAEGDEQLGLDTLRSHTEKCLPCGSQEFVKAMEGFTGRALQCRPRGRPTGSNRRKAEKGARPL